MKNTFCLLLLCVSLGYAQDVATIESGMKPTYNPSRNAPAEKLLKKEDFKLSNGRMVVSDVNCNILNEDRLNTVLVSVVCKHAIFNEVGVDTINKMILFANGKVRNSINVSHGYKPKEIKMAYNPESQIWSMTNLFGVEDENGKIKTSMLTFDFDSTGNFVVMKRIF